MDHRITHCCKQECPESKNCYRYLAYLDAVQTKVRIVSMLLPEEMPCQMRWIVKQK